MSLVLLGILNSQAAGAGGAGGFDLLETQILTSATNTISFTGLDSLAANYNHLQLRAVMQDTDTGTNLNRMDVQLNGDTGTNYTYNYLNGNGSTVNGSYGQNYDAFKMFDVISAQVGGTSTAFAGIIMDILDFSNPNKNTTGRSMGGGVQDGTNEKDIMVANGTWLNTAAVTQIDIKNTRNYTIGSRFSLYGWA